jgi:predicted transcriptional regulator
MMTGVKQAMLELAQQLPEECTWDDVLYQVYVRKELEAGLKDADEGRTVRHEEEFWELLHEDDPLD